MNKLQINSKMGIQQLFADRFCTIRFLNIKRFSKNDIIEIHVKNNIVMLAKIERKYTCKLGLIPEYIHIWAHGYDRNEGLKMLATMYKNSLRDVSRDDFCVLILKRHKIVNYPLFKELFFNYSS